MYDKVDRIAESLRQEPYIFFKSNCIAKAVRFKRMCADLDIPAKVVVCIGLCKAKWFGHWVTLPAVHSWGEVRRKRVEVSRPLGQTAIWGIAPTKIKPLVAVRF